MLYIDTRVVLKLVFAHGLLTRWTLTGQGILNQFFIGKIVDKLVKWINKYTELHLLDGKRLQVRHCKH